MWKSLHIEVYRDTHDQASTSVAGDQHGLLFGSWMISGRVRRRMRRPPMIIYLIPVGLASCAAGRPRQSGVGGAPTALPREAASPTISGASRVYLPAVVLIIFVVTTVVDRG